MRVGQNIAQKKKQSSPLPKLGASGILFRFGKVLLGRRSLNDESLPGQWCTPGGQVEFGEPIEQAIFHEFLEEVVIRVVVCSGFVSIKERIGDGKHTVLVFKHVTEAAGNLRTVEPTVADGFCEVGWFSQEEIKDMVTGDRQITSLTRAALNDFFLYYKELGL